MNVPQRGDITMTQPEFNQAAESSRWLALTVTAVALLAVIVGCSSGEESPVRPSIDNSKYADELTNDEVRAYCEYITPLQGEPGDYFCVGRSGEMTVLAVDSCIQGYSTLPEGTSPWHCPVGDFMDCYESIGTDICNYPNTDGCAALRLCFTMH
jgi:hypothetical protein